MHVYFAYDLFRHTTSLIMLKLRFVVMYILCLVERHLGIVLVNSRETLDD